MIRAVYTRFLETCQGAVALQFVKVWVIDQISTIRVCLPCAVGFPFVPRRTVGTSFTGLGVVPLAESNLRTHLFYFL